MKLTFNREFDGDVEKLPKREVEGSTIFREPKSIAMLSLIANGIGIALMILLIIPVIKLCGGRALFDDYWQNMTQTIVALALCCAILPVHELLHAVCFKEEVRFYTYLRKGLMFVVGTEDMTKGRFVFMSMLPNLVFGFLPYILFFIFPSQLWLGLTGAINIGSGAGDYINVFNALTQMPKGAVCYMSGNRTYWYMPKK